MQLSNLLEKIGNIRVGIIGDFCLDVYWLADMKKSRLSRETPHYPLPVVQERYAPGGAGNVACNVAALRPRAIYALGVLGKDWRGQLLKESLDRTGVDTEVLIADASRVTNAYIKPLRKGISETVYEDPRLDFENELRLSKGTEALLLGTIEQLDVDVICVCDQMESGCISPAVRDKLCSLGEKGKLVIVDSRERVALYKNVIVKPNEVEAMHAMQGCRTFEEAAVALSTHTGKPAIVTMGEKGCLVCENGQISAVPARKVAPPVDICGAGDTFLSAFACALAAGEQTVEAARFASLASAVTIQKIHMTGTASREEIQANWEET